MTLKRRAWTLGAAVAITAVIVLLVPRFDLGFLASGRQDLQAAESQIQRGIQLYQQGAFPAAEVELNKTMEAYPDEWRAPFYLGIIKTFLKQFDQSIPYLEQAFLLNPTEPKIPNALGVAYFKLGRLDMAKGYFAVSLELDPANTDTKAIYDSMAKLQRRTRLAADKEQTSL